MVSGTGSPAGSTGLPSCPSPGQSLPVVHGPVLCQDLVGPVFLLLLDTHYVPQLGAGQLPVLVLGLAGKEPHTCVRPAAEGAGTGNRGRALQQEGTCSDVIPLPRARLSTRMSRLKPGGPCRNTGPSRGTSECQPNIRVSRCGPRGLPNQPACPPAGKRRQQARLAELSKNHMGRAPTPH